ncbi:MAG: type II toxin-antitoxin system Phd/YefM family antitoxin [Candidatus Binatia bacterium]
MTTGDYLGPTMKAVGVKQLKAHLSEYLRMTKAGETVLVTERDEVIAELRPARRQPAPSTDLEDILDDLAAAGQIVRASRPKGAWTWKASGIGLAPGTAAAILDHLREDR